MACKQLKVLIIGMSPDIVQKSLRLKGLPLAPMVLKAYVDNRIAKECPDFSALVDIRIKTFFVEEENPAEIASKILSDKPNIVAFSVYLWNYQEVMECVRIIKSKDSQIVVICGGPQVSPVAVETMSEHPNIDVIPYITVPGEIIFYYFIKSFLEKRGLDSIAGIIYRNSDNRLIKTALPTEELDYSTVPSPYLDDSFSLPSGELYTVVLETSRGCPFDCGYCFYGRDVGKVHYFPLERLLKEIEVVYNNPNIKQVMYADSDVFQNHERIKVIINHILRQNSKVVSELDVNILSISKDTVEMLAKIPNYRFCFGIQTVNPKALKCIGKLRPTLNLFSEKFRAFKHWAQGVEYCIDIMLGLPGDDFSGFRNTLDVCLSFEPTRLRPFYPVYLLPGTRFFEQKEILGIRHNSNPPYCIIETESFPKQDIEKALRLGLWMEILTYFYPAIGRFFFSVCEGGEPGGRVGKLEEWIGKITNNLDIFDCCQSIVDVVITGSTQEWNKLKGNILRKASAAESAYKIYHVIQQQEKKTPVNAMKRTIDLGVRIFDYLFSHGGASVGFTDFEQLPDTITRGSYSSEISSVFSRYRP